MAPTQEAPKQLPNKTQHRRSSSYDTKRHKPETRHYKENGHYMTVHYIDSADESDTLKKVVNNDTQQISEWSYEPKKPSAAVKKPSPLSQYVINFNDDSTTAPLPVLDASVSINADIESDEPSKVNGAFTWADARKQRQSESNGNDLQSQNFDERLKILIDMQDFVDQIDDLRKMEISVSLDKYLRDVSDDIESINNHYDFLLTRFPQDVSVKGMKEHYRKGLSESITNLPKMPEESSSDKGILTKFRLMLIKAITKLEPSNSSLLYKVKEKLESKNAKAEKEYNEGFNTAFNIINNANKLFINKGKARSPQACQQKRCV